ncbi:putative peroxisomal N(1)-acetyl-spermine/spermidine oxidase [Triangularia setosa]|uniref:Peroxisomal N(1)-acetyl-spermine/spermidine oxidase n=1 Tax=Triangularia setosa TaxID=2587417 RepID=A0AAN6WE49_9PEZI|nr:putative peroxisomal N(1)-acetyl-spermine/spermidine oxidase [Podospora setosa]
MFLSRGGHYLFRRQRLPSSLISSASHKVTSKLYQDLKTARLHTFDRSHRKLNIMDRVLQLESQAPNRRSCIGIVGAGFAGLRCADILIRYGFQVTILEARNRLGGRIHQERLPNGTLIDMGANWIHGTDNNPILDLAKETKTHTGVFDSESYVFDEDGALLSAKEGEKYSTIMWNIIGEAFEYSEKHGAEIDADKTLLDFFEEQIPKQIPDTEEDYERQRHFVLQMADLWGAFVGSPVKTQSLKFFWLEECIDGENLFCAGTYHKILERVAKPAVDGADIRYGTTVSEIYGKSTSPSETVRVKTVDGQVLEFDGLVVTTPLGWLKQNTRAFHPSLPERLSKAIENIGYGCLEKVYISFPTPFWLSPDADGRKVRGFCQWLSPNYSEDTNPSRWTNEIVELASLGPSSHPTLLFYTYGDESRHITSTLRSLPSQKEKLDFLFNFFQPYYSRLPSYDEQNPDCHPTVAIATDWLSDDFAGNGSYANFQKGLKEGDKDIEIMRQGLPGEGIWLAGEHTAPFVALGTVTGAYWSGEGVAKKVAGSYGKRMAEKAGRDDAIID